MIGQTISHYRIIEKLGEGGMGVVYLAEHTLLGRRVAIKTLTVGGFENQHFRSRFLREAQAVSKLSHSNIANVYDYGETDQGQPYIVMELVEGKTLNELMREETLTIARSIEIVKQVAGALSEAHQHRIVHRDIKPSNIAINERGVVKVLDFGLAKHAPSAAVNTGSQSSLAHTQTREGVIVGTPLYLSPEQALGVEVDARSDLFSLGSVLYECIAGRPAFAGKSDIDICAKVIRDDPPPPSECNENIPQRLEQITLRALAKKPENRYQTATELIADLDQLDQQTLPSHRPDIQPGRATSRLFSTSSIARVSNLLKRPRLSFGYLLLTVGIIGIIAFLLWRFSRPSLHQPDISLRTRYDRAVEAMHEGSFFRASKLLQDILKDDDKFVLAHARLAEAYAELDESDKSQVELISAQELVPNASKLAEVDRQTWQAIVSVVKRDFGQATANYAALANRVAATEKQFALVDLGRAQEKNSETEKAIGSYEQAVKLDASYAAAFLRLGVVYGRIGRTPDAFNALDRAYKLFETNGDIEGLAELSLQRAVLLTQSSKVAEASEQLMNALDKAKVLEHREKQIKVLLNLSNNQILAGNPTQAQTYSTMATDLARDNKMENLTIQGLIDIGTAYFVKGYHADAKRNFNDALRLAQHYTAQRSEARAYLSLASEANHENNAVEARDFCQKALPFYRIGGYRKELSQLYTILGHAQDQTGEYEQALQTFQQQLTGGEAEGDPQQMGWAHEGLGVVFNHTEKYQDALIHFREQHKIHEQLGNNILKSYAAMNLGTMYWQVADYDNAKTSLNEALTFADTKDHPSKELLGWIHVSLARMELSRENFSEAIKEGQLALNVTASEMKAINIQAKSAIAIGLARTGKIEDARKNISDAVSLANSLADPLLLSKALLAKAQVEYASKDFAAALAIAQDAAARFANAGQHDSEWRCWLIVAQCLARQPNSVMRDYAAHASSTLASLGQELGQPAFTGYQTRKDVQAGQVQLARLAPQ